MMDRSAANGTHGRNWIRGRLICISIISKVLPSFTGFSLGDHGEHWVWVSWTMFHVIVDFDRLLRVSLCFLVSYSVFLGFTGFYWVLLGCNGVDWSWLMFSCVSLDLIMFQWVLIDVFFFIFIAIFFWFAYLLIQSNRNALALLKGLQQSLLQFFF